MAANFKIGDLVWAKMKGFPAWPGKVIAPKTDVKRPAGKKTHQFVFFFGSENYAWIPEENIHDYPTHRSRFTLTQRIPRGYKEALEAVEDCLRANPTEVSYKTSDLPSIEEELAQIFPHRKDAPHKDYTREPLSGRKRLKSPTPPPTKPTTITHAKNKARDKRTPVPAPASVARGRRRSSREEQKEEIRPIQQTDKGDARPGRKSREPGKLDARMPARRQSTKRTSSPVNTPAKRGRPLKSLGSPGRSAAPTDLKPLGGLPVDSIEQTAAGPPKQQGVIPTPLKIGFLGLGIMGHGMVNNLIQTGHEVTVWNRTQQKCREFVKEGALKGNTPAEVVASCDITFSCVSDPAAVKDLVFGNYGVLQGIEPGKGFVDMSTIDADTVADVNEAVAARGGRYLEAPVVGSRGPATSGDLIILSAGDRTLYEDCYSCFEAIGKKTFFLGEITSGAKMKLVVNMLMGTIVAGLAESLALADKVGLDQDALLQIFDLSALSCPLIHNKGEAIMMSRFEPQFPLQHQQKDLRLAINMADSVDQPLHVATATNELFKKAKAKGYSQHDMCAVYRAADV